MERAVQIYAIINLSVIGISHVVRPQVWVDFFVFLRERGEAGVFAVAVLNLIFGSIIVALTETPYTSPIVSCNRTDAAPTRRRMRSRISFRTLMN